MAKPILIPTWATDATFVDPPEAWDSDPTRVDPGAGKRAQGWYPQEVPPAEVFNHEQGLIGEWLEWLDSHWSVSDQHVYPTPIVRETRIVPAQMQIESALGGATFSLSPSTTVGRYGALSMTSNGLVRARINLSRHLPQGAVIDQIRAAVDFDNATTSPRIELQIERWLASFSSWVASGPAAAIVDSTTSLDSVTVADPTARYVLDSGTGLGITVGGPGEGNQVLMVELSGDNQELYEIEIDWSDVGLTNI